MEGGGLERLERVAARVVGVERGRPADQAARDWATVRRDREALAAAYDMRGNRAPPRLTGLSPGGRAPRVVTSLAIRAGDGAACARV